MDFYFKILELLSINTVPHVDLICLPKFLALIDRRDQPLPHAMEFINASVQALAADYTTCVHEELDYGNDSTVNTFLNLHDKGSFDQLVAAAVV